MNRLYLLAFLLTADHTTAEKCFVWGLEDSKKGNLVFKEWAQSWARRTIIAECDPDDPSAPQLADGSGDNLDLASTLARSGGRDSLEHSVKM